MPDDLGSGLVADHVPQRCESKRVTRRRPAITSERPSIQGGAITRSWFLLSRVEVAAAPRVGGDRGVRRFDHRWNEIDARHEQPVARSPGRRLPLRRGQFAVHERRVSRGNRVLSEAQCVRVASAATRASTRSARFDRDVLAQPGVTHVDRDGRNQRHRHAGRMASAVDDLIAAHRQIIDRAHERGLRDLRGDADAV